MGALKGTKMVIQGLLMDALGAAVWLLSATNRGGVGEMRTNKAPQARLEKRYPDALHRAPSAGHGLPV